MYTEKELAAIAKRENNTKRKYLVVNRLQGKHIPVSPKDVFLMYKELADGLECRYRQERLLLIGFAETATAIGAALAVTLNTYYIQTTRENISGVEYLYFSESHSHATEQKLIKNDLDKVIDEIDRIVFVEDEVTTGNTILNIINLIQKTYLKKLKFSVASLLNGMNLEAKTVYTEREIDTVYLVKTNHDGYTDIAERYRGDGIYHKADIRNKDIAVHWLQVSDYVNARRLNKGNDYAGACERLWEEIRTKIHIGGKKRILVAGTEEFMYPALYAAEKMEKMDHIVKCHSTTRSPIAVSTEEEYPLHERYELVSFYDRNRITYIYDIGCYDMVFVITDAEQIQKEGLYSLLNALDSCGNKNITLIRWC